MSAHDAALAEWIGRSETIKDTVTTTPVAALAATLDRPAEDVPPGTILPPLWHWLYFLPRHRQSEIGADGHATSMENIVFHPIPEDDSMRHALCLSRRSRAAAILASSFAMTSSAGIQSRAVSERAMEAMPRLMNSDCSTLSPSACLM